MTTARRLLEKLLTQDSGQDVMEYVLLAALLGMCAAVALRDLPKHRRPAIQMGVWYGRHHSHPPRAATSEDSTRLTAEGIPG